MKKRIITLIIATLLAASSALAAPCASAAGSSVKYDKKDVKAYIYGMDETATFSCLFRADLPDVPYIGASDYLNRIYTEPFTTEKNSDGTYTVSNKNGDITVDVDKDTVFFDSFEDVTYNDARPFLEDETSDYIETNDKKYMIGEEKSVLLDLAEYDIDLTADGGEVYFPLTTINDIFAGTYHAALYIEDELYFADVMEDEPYYDDSSLFDSLKRDKALAEYSYNELCFVMDNFYGCPPNSKLSESIKESGFDKALAGYDKRTAEARQYLKSVDLLDYMYGMMYLDEYLSDGGHTVMSYGMQLGLDSAPDSKFTEAFMTSAATDKRYYSVLGYYQDAIADQYSEEALGKYRDQEYSKLKEVKTWDDASFYTSGSTGVFVFDEFKDAVVEPFKWSLDYADENGLDNFLIDLSLNGGGSTAVAVYMLSVMRDNSRSDYVDTLSGNRFYTIDTVDKNLDDKFDEADDDVEYDMNFAILTSKTSFSCANLMPCLAQDSGIAIIGEKSGGGTCAVSVHYDAYGFAYALSDCTMMIHKDGGDLDGGAVPDYAMPGDRDNYVGFYDIDRISEGIGNYYSGKLQPATEAATEGGTGEIPSHAEIVMPEGIGMYIWICSAALSAVPVIIFVIVLIAASRKKKKS